jgi:hypothetical protein
LTLGGTAQKSKSSVRAGPRYLIIVIFEFLAVVLLNGTLLILHCDMNAAFFWNLGFDLLFLVLLLSLDSTLNKKTLLWGFRLIKWMKRKGLIEEQYQESDEATAQLEVPQF